ncbi:MAG: hypothetical protein ACFCUH_06605 [Flavobacteriales bacterium]
MTRFHTLTLDNAAPHEVAYLYGYSGADHALFAYFLPHRNAFITYFFARTFSESGHCL